MRRTDVLRAWGRILQGYRPALSIEITNRCPLACPGCYAYQPEHLGGIPLESLTDRQGDDLVEAALALVDEHRPLSVHVVGGEPLVRYRELGELLPRLSERGIAVEVVTSAVRRIPPEWAGIEGVRVVVSIDGLQPEHDARRKPATYDRILKHVEGHRIYVHCTVTSQMMRREGYLDEFLAFWAPRPGVDQVRISFYTPQIGEESVEILTPEMRRRAIDDLERLGRVHPELLVTPGMLAAYEHPPESPEACVFAKVTRCVSADFETEVTPCQLGGNPDCARCGCVASVGLHAVGDYRLPGGLRAGTVFGWSERVGRGVSRARAAVGG